MPDKTYIGRLFLTWVIAVPGMIALFLGGIWLAVSMLRWMWEHAL